MGILALIYFASQINKKIKTCLRSSVPLAGKLGPAREGKVVNHMSNSSYPRATTIFSAAGVLGLAALLVQRLRRKGCSEAVKNAQSFERDATKTPLDLEVAETLRADFERDGVVMIKGAIPLNEITQLRKILEDVMATGEGMGGRIDASSEGATGRFVMELEANRWHVGLREFAHRGTLPGMVSQLLNTSTLRFFMDHVFQKDAGSNERTEYHQDLPFFPFVGSQAA